MILSKLFFSIILLLHCIIFNPHVNMHDFFAAQCSSWKLDHHDIFTRMHMLWIGPRNCIILFLKKIILSILLHSFVYEKSGFGGRIETNWETKTTKEETNMGPATPWAWIPRRWTTMAGPTYDAEIQKFFLGLNTFEFQAKDGRKPRILGGQGSTEGKREKRGKKRKK